MFKAVSMNSSGSTFRNVAWLAVWFLLEFLGADVVNQPVRLNVIADILSLNIEHRGSSDIKVQKLPQSIFKYQYTDREGYLAFCYTWLFSLLRQLNCLKILVKTELKMSTVQDLLLERRCRRLVNCPSASST